MGKQRGRLTASSQELLLESVQCASNLTAVLPNLDEYVVGAGAIARIPSAALDPRSETTSFAIITSKPTGTIVADGTYMKVEWESAPKARKAITGKKRYAHNPVRGYFYVTVGKPGRRAPGPRAYLADGTAIDAPPNLTGDHLPTLTRDELAREVRTLANRHDAFSDRLFHKCKPGIGHLISQAKSQATSACDGDDVEQEANAIVVETINKFLDVDTRPSTNLIDALCTVARRELPRLEEKGKAGYGEETRRWHKFFHSQADLDLATTSPKQWAERWFSRDNVARTRSRQLTAGRDASINYLDTVSDDEFSKTVDQITRALTLLVRVETPASLDETVPGGDDDSMTLADSLIDSSEAIEEVAIRNTSEPLMRTTTRNWFNGSGLAEDQLIWAEATLDFFRKATAKGLRSPERADAFAASDMVREMTYVLQPLTATDETLTNSTHLNRVSDRLRAIYLRDQEGGRRIEPRQSEEVERLWQLALTDPDRQDRCIETLTGDLYDQAELIDDEATISR